ncbi:MAG: hypothetical protein LBR27_09395 [Bifidobacteriaceae bacterium]|jgi:hypothetical protein|nr:hypothetical protein [Bifidobacteriaceae bacterium]
MHAAVRSSTRLLKLLVAGGISAVMAATLAGLPAVAQSPVPDAAPAPQAAGAPSATLPAGDLTVEVVGTVYIVVPELWDEVEGATAPDPIVQIVTEAGTLLPVTDPELQQQLTSGATVSAEVQVPAAEAAGLAAQDQAALAGDAQDGAIDGTSAPAEALLAVATQDEAVAVTEVTVLEEPAAAPDLAPGSPVTHRFWTVIVEPVGGPIATGTVASQAEKNEIQGMLDGTAAYYEQHTGWDFDFALTTSANVIHMQSPTLCAYGLAYQTVEQAAAQFGQTASYFREPGRHLLLISKTDNAQCQAADGYRLGLAAYANPGPLSVTGGGDITVIKWGPLSDFTWVLAHELGHSFGLSHASIVPCAPAPGTAAGSFDENNHGACGWVEYGDPYDMMGGGPYISPAHRYVWDMLSAGQYEVVDAENVTNRSIGLYGSSLSSTVKQLAVIPSPVSGVVYYVEHRYFSATDARNGVYVFSFEPHDWGQYLKLEVPVSVYSRPSPNLQKIPAGTTYTAEGGAIKVTVQSTSSARSTVLVSRTNAQYVAFGPDPLRGSWIAAEGTTPDKDFSRTVYSRGAAWTASVPTAESWISLTTTAGPSGASVTARVAANTSLHGRTGRINVTAGGVTKQIWIYQLGSDDCADSSSTTCVWTLNSVTASTITKGLQAENDKDWLRFTAPASGTWQFASSGLPTGADVDGALYNASGVQLKEVKDDTNFTLSYSLTQGQTYYLQVWLSDTNGIPQPADPYTITATPPPNVSTTPTALTLAQPSGSTATAVVTTNQSRWTASSNQTWLTVTPTSGVTGATLTVRATSANTGTTARSATVTITAGSVTTYLTVTQARLVCSNPILSVSVSGTKVVGYTLAAVAVTNPTTAPKTFQWYRGTTPIPGAIYSTYTLVAADANQAVKVRVTSVVSGCSAASLDSAAYAVAPPILTPTPTVVYLPPEGGSATVGVSTNQASWTATANGTWIAVAKAASSIAVSATANTSTAQRSTTVTLRAGVATPVNVTVIQYGEDCGGSLTAYCSWSLSSTAPTSITRKLEYAADVDFFRFTAPSSGLWTFQSSGIPSGSDIYGYLWSAAGVQLALDDDSAGNRNFRISYTLTVGTVYYLRVKNYLSTTTISASPYTITATPPTPGPSITALTVSGTVAVGNTLTANPTYTPLTATLTYQWYRAGVAISGATARTYTLAWADGGQSVTVKVTATANNQSAARTSSSLAVPATGVAGRVVASDGGSVAGWSIWIHHFTCGPPNVLMTGTANDQNYGTLSSDGTFAVGKFADECYQVNVLTPQGYTIPTTYNGSTQAYQYIRSGTRNITLTVPTKITMGTASISGTKTVGYTLTANLSSVVPSNATLEYQWYRNGVAISGATARTYLLVAADGGAAVYVKITGTVRGFASVYKNSASYTIAHQPDECGQSTSSYCLWTLGSGTTATITKGLQTGPDYDWLRITPTVAGTYTFVSSSPAGADLYGNLLNASGGSLLADDDGAGYPNFKLTYTLKAGTTYYIQVRHYSASTTKLGNPYTITATRS